MIRIDRPSAGEYAPYYEKYVAQMAGESDVLAALERLEPESLALWGGLDARRALHRYAPDKWSIKQLVGHLIDTERVFAFRALWFARGDPGPLPSMEQDDWVREGRFDDRPVAELAEEYRMARRSTLLLFRGLDPVTFTRRGVASGKEVTVRAFPWIIAGHERHHLAVLRERYGLK